MTLSLSRSRNGTPTCTADGLWLHSPYDPAREALRFARSELGTATPSHIVLLGPCLDYLSPALRSLLPGARIAAVQYSGFFADSPTARAGDLEESGDFAAWYPDSGSSLEAFLDAALDEDAISGVAVLEWEPASRAFPAEAGAARKAVKESLDRLNASTATVKASGRRWIANACASFLLVERAFAFEASSLPILVAAAGPSLRPSLLGLPRGAGSFATIAVSSALTACRSAGIEPDLVVATDGGYWSRLHLYPLAAEPLPLASPLTALPSSSVYRRSGLMLLDQGSFAESELLPALCPAIAIPSHGTVSGTAILLASRLSTGPIIVAGLDLASYGDMDHARPHGFDPVTAISASRIAPLETAAWERSALSAPVALPEAPWRWSRSLAAYASALSLDARPLAGRLFRINPSPVSLPGFGEMSPGEAAALLAGKAPLERGIRLRSLGLPSRAEREAFLKTRLAAWRELADAASQDLRLGRLPSSPLVAELLRSLDIVDYAAARRAILAGGEPSSAALDLSARCDTFLAGLVRRFCP